MADADPLDRILKRDGTEVPFDREKIRVAVYKAGAALGRHDKALSEATADEVVGVLNRTYTSQNPPTVEDIQDVVVGALRGRGCTEVANAYIQYRAKRAALRERRQGGRRRIPEPIPYKVIWRGYVWAVDHGVHTVEALNRRIREGGYPSLVRESDEAYESQVAEAAREILQYRDQVRIVVVAGPSSSGKTTTTIKLGEKLEAGGLRLKALNVDNYFFDLDLHPKDASGDYDFETPEALDLNLINRHLADLLAGREILTPFYNFKTGRREGPGTPFRLEKDEILLIDTLHGLYDEMTRAVPPEAKYKLYIESLAQTKGPGGRFVRWYDVRLLRRMIRDTLHRSYDPRKTLMHWHYVRRSELKHIIPFIHDADFIVNSALPYELPALKARLFPHFPRFLEEFRGDAARQDAFLRAQRVHDLLASVDEWRDDSVFAPKSLIREFIGGSAYKY
ncbi:MAG: ATP cone domain-containing protein [Planctomycetes bacterium]|jgi:uridine kinase|nr:ATP cone domain-containing protein [Planctomycetota bacterium]